MEQEHGEEDTRRTTRDGTRGPYRIEARAISEERFWMVLTVMTNENMSELEKELLLFCGFYNLVAKSWISISMEK